MDLELLSGEEIVSREIATGVPIVYVIDKDGECTLLVRRTMHSLRAFSVTGKILEKTELN